MLQRGCPSRPLYAMLYPAPMTSKPDQDERDQKAHPPAESQTPPADSPATVSDARLRTGIPNEDELDLLENLQRPRSDGRRIDMRLIVGTLLLIAVLGALILVGRAIYLHMSAKSKPPLRPTTP